MKELKVVSIPVELSGLSDCLFADTKTSSSPNCAARDMVVPVRNISFY